MQACGQGARGLPAWLPADGAAPPPPPPPGCALQQRQGQLIPEDEVMRYFVQV